MKKAAVIILTVIMCVSFAACSGEAKSDNDGDTGSNIEVQTTKALPQASTTAKAKEDGKKAQELVVTIAKALNVDTDETVAKENGKFTFKRANIEETVMFSEEYSQEGSDRAYANIDEFVSRIKDYYPDGDKLQLYDTCDQQIGGGDNGIDSVIYIAVYTNTQNQALSVFADSTGEIYYAECNFTW